MDTGTFRGCPFGAKVLAIGAPCLGCTSWPLAADPVREGAPPTYTPLTLMAPMSADWLKFRSIPARGRSAARSVSVCRVARSDDIATRSAARSADGALSPAMGEGCDLAREEAPEPMYAPLPEPPLLDRCGGIDVGEAGGVMLLPVPLLS